MTTSYERTKAAVMRLADSKNASGKLLVGLPATRDRTMVFLLDKAILEAAIAEQRQVTFEEIGNCVFLGPSLVSILDPEVYPLEVTYQTPMERKGCLIPAGCYREDEADRVAGYILRYLTTGEPPA